MMYNFHVACDDVKRAITLPDDDCSYTDLTTCITLKFNLGGRGFAIQYFHSECNDWLNLDDDEKLPANKSKLKVILQDDPKPAARPEADTQHLHVPGPSQEDVEFVDNT